MSEFSRRDFLGSAAPAAGLAAASSNRAEAEMGDPSFQNNE